MTSAPCKFYTRGLLEVANFKLSVSREMLKGFKAIMIHCGTAGTKVTPISRDPHFESILEYDFCTIKGLCSDSTDPN